MKQEEFPELTDQELLQEAKELKSFSMTNAFFIGFLIAIVVFSIVKNTFGLVSLIPLYFIYKLVNDPKNKRSKELEKIMQERNLK